MTEDVRFDARAAPEQRIEALCRRLLRPVDAAWLSVLRVGIGLTLCVSMLRFLAYGWSETQFTAPSFHFSYWGAAWVPRLPDALMPWLFVVLAILSCALAAGLYFRISAGLFTLGFAYLQLADATNYLNHYYLALLLAGLAWVSPAGRFHSLDALLEARASARRRGHVTQPRPVCAAAWLLVFRLQVGLVYFFAGLGKLQSDWLLWGQPLGIWLASRSDLPVVGPWLREPGVALAMSWAGFAFDTTVPLWLSWQRTRAVAYAILIAFHVVTRVLFPIGMFPVIMVLAALVFFPPDWPRALGARVRARWTRGGAGPARAPATDAARGRVRRRERYALIAAALHCAIQLALPLRCHLYGGNVAWHEQGMRWSWRVMLREKNGSVSFRVRSERSGRSWEISPARYLTRLQEREMSGQPELIWQLAQHIRRDFERRGLGPVSVRADAWVSLNGRRAQRLIDPDVDLTSVGSGLRDAKWILPAPISPPPPAAPRSELELRSDVDEARRVGAGPEGPA